MANEDIKGTKSIKDYILSDEEVLKIKPKKKRTLLPAHANVRVLFQSGCDFGIEKKQGRTISQLITLVSKDQFYIKTGKTIVPLSLRRMKDFIRGIGEDHDFGDGLLFEELENYSLQDFMELLKDGGSSDS